MQQYEIAEGVVRSRSGETEAITVNLLGQKDHLLRACCLWSFRRALAVDKNRYVSTPKFETPGQETWVMNRLDIRRPYAEEPSCEWGGGAEEPGSRWRGVTGFA